MGGPPAQGTRRRAFFVARRLGHGGEFRRLIYILLADRDVEIVADRGYLGSIDDAGWLAACQLMEDLFRNGRFEAGLLDGVARVSALMAGAFPASEDVDGNELPDAPVII
jgi:uncharacterized membrane protein